MSNKKYLLTFDQYPKVEPMENQLVNNGQELRQYVLHETQNKNHVELNVQN